MRHLPALALLLLAPPALAADDPLMAELRASLPEGVTMFVCAGDLDSGRWSADRADEPVEAASLIKIPLMAAVERRLAERQLRGDDAIDLRLGPVRVAVALPEEPPAETETITVAEAVERMVARSDNAAARALVDRLTMPGLNRAFAAMGLPSTQIGQYVGGPLPERNVTSARDIARSLADMYPRGRPTPAQRRMQQVLEGQTFRGRFRRLLPERARLGHKTGTSKHVVAEAGVIDRRVVLVVILRAEGNAFRQPLLGQMERAVATIGGRLAERFGVTLR